MKLTTISLIAAISLLAACDVAEDHVCLEEARCGASNLTVRECVRSDGSAFWTFSNGIEFEQGGYARDYCEQMCRPGELCGVTCVDGELGQTCATERDHEICVSVFGPDLEYRFSDGKVTQDSTVAAAYCRGCDPVRARCEDDREYLKCYDGGGYFQFNTGATFEDPEEAAEYCGEMGTH